VRGEKTVAFEKVFEICNDRVHALFLFLSTLELTQQKYMKLLVGEGMNNFIIEWNDNREIELKEEGLTDEDLPSSFTDEDVPLEME